MVEKIEGYKTILVAAVGLLAAVAGFKGYVITLEEQAAICTGIMSLIMVGMRLVTKTPFFKG